MLKMTVPASALTINPVTRLTFSYAKTKENLTKIFQAHNDRYEKEKRDGKTELVNFPQSFINTAFTLTQLFIAEFQKGKVRNSAMRMCKSYIKGHMVGAKLSVRTIDRHINRLLDGLTVPFISQKSRSTLGDIVEPGKDRNCIAISFAEGIIAQEETIENSVGIKIAEKSNLSTIDLVKIEDQTEGFWAAEINKNLKKFDQEPPKRAF